MRIKVVLCLLTLVTLISMAAPQAVDPTKKLGVFLGKWQTEASFTGSDIKIASTLECHWSPQSSYLVCEQLIKAPDGDHHQLTVYSFNSKEGNYSYSTIGDPGGKPTSGTVEIKDNIWIYSSIFENNGKTTLIRTTNEFTSFDKEIFKVERSDDGGATWKTLLQGAASKVGV
jgi:hypothetical protein